ncbi:MAG: ABC transporter ATP-binding protein [FCB group bacterium]|nr:ABC transporter ATP-binding protein [FCB group bacterium]
MQLPLFEIKNVLVQQNKFRALDIKNFEIHRGAIYSVTGKSAAGKTVFLEVLARMTPISGGKVIFEGKEIGQYSRKDFLNNIAFVEQSVKSPRWTTVAQYLRKTLSGYTHTKRDMDKRIEAISKKMEITYLMEKSMRSLTPGQLRWIELSAKIAADTKVLFIDEVEQHLSADALNNLSRILHRKSNYDGVTIILTTMNPELIKKIVSVHIAMQGGRISSVRSFGKKSYDKRRSSGRNDYRKTQGRRDDKSANRSNDRRSSRNSSSRKSRAAGD